MIMTPLTGHELMSFAFLSCFLFRVSACFLDWFMLRYLT